MIITQIDKDGLQIELKSAIYKQFLENNKGKRVKIQLVKENRTLTQNNYLWLYLTIVERDTGNSQDDMHTYIKRHLTPKIEKTIKLLKDGEWVEHKGMVGKGTSELNKIEFGEMLDKLGALTGVPLPDPKEAGYYSEY